MLFACALDEFCFSYVVPAFSLRLTADSEPEA
jgi:hypothetical protein